MKKEWGIMVVSIGCFVATSFDVWADETLSFYEVNPPYIHLKNKNDLNLYRPTIRKDNILTTVLCSSETEFREQLLSNYRQRNTTFQLQLVWDFTFSDMYSITEDANTFIKQNDDYTYYSIYSIRWEASGFAGNVTMTFTIDYWTSAMQEDAVNQRVGEILAEIIQPGMNEEEKQKVIHDWIVLNVEYDQTLVNYSAYAALFDSHETVCQGYALLAQKMFTEVSMSSRIIDGGNHAWNLVNVCDNWYHMDTTWDDPIVTPPDSSYILWDYLHLSDKEMDRDHDWFAEDSANWPEAPFLFETGRCTQTTTLPISVIMLLLK